MAFLVFKEKSKNLFSIFFAILFFVLSFWANGVLRAEAAGEIYCSDSWAPGEPCISNAEDCVSCSGFVSTCTVNAPNLNEFTILVSNLASCSSENKYCLAARCPVDNASFSEGDLCSVRILDGASVVTSSDSHWDKSEGNCIQCNGNEQYSVCGSTAGLYLSTLGACVGLSAYDGNLDSACDAGVVPQCDEKAVGAACNPPVGTCSAVGLCEASVALVLTVSASPTSVALSGASTITFSVTKDGTPISGATVSGISVTAGSGNVSAASCTTAAAGTCTVTYFAPAVATIATISATKASNGVDTDSGSASASVTVTSCSGADYSAYDNDPYNVGDTMQLDGHNTNDFSLCIYDDAGTLKQESNFCTSPTPKSLTSLADSVGTWKGSAVSGCAPGTCSDPFSIAIGCPSSTTVNAAPAACDNDGVCEPPGETIAGCPADCGGGDPVTASFCESALVASDLGKLCGSYTVQAADVAAPGGWCCANVSFVFFSATAQTDCQDSDPACAGGGGGGGEICNDAGIVDEDSNGLANCADTAACPDGTGCEGGGTCQGGACVPAGTPCGGPGMLVSPLGPGYCSIAEILEKATNYILSLVSAIIILIIIIGGLMYISSTGDEERMRTSKNIILYAIIGFGIILISYALITEVVDVIRG